MIHVLHTRFDTEVPDERCAGWIEAMPADVREKINRYRRWQDRQSALYGRLLLAAGLRLSDPRFEPPDLERMAFNEHGRPFIEGLHDFNISHSGGCVVCAVSDEGRVGIDVERIRDLEIDDFTKYLPEVKSFPAGDPAERLRLFFDCWTRKESVVKADGRGIALGLQTVRLEGNKAFAGEDVWFLHKVEVGDGYSCHVAVSHEGAEVRPAAMNMDNCCRIL